MNTLLFTSKATNDAINAIKEGKEAEFYEKKTARGGRSI